MKVTTTQFENSSLNKILNYLIVGLILLVNLPVYFSQTYPGLDPSYFYLLNVAANKGLKFGSDLFITYGPLGFLVSTQNFGNNIIINIIFWSIIFIINAFALYYIIIKRNVHFLTTLFSLITITLLNNILAEYYLLYVIILLISLAWLESKNYYYFVIACLITLLLMFIKFSGALGALSCIILFIFSMYFKDKSTALKNGLISLGIPLFFIIGYLLYNPSFEALKDYLISAFEISSGYNSAMSLLRYSSINFFILTFSFAIILLLFYIGFTIYFIIKDKQKGLFLLIFSGTIFFAFKHGFVRCESFHRSLFFVYYLVLISVIILCIDLFNNKLRSWHLLVPFYVLTIIVLTILCFDFDQNYYLETIKSKRDKIFSISNQIKNPIIKSKENILNKVFLDSITDKTVLIYPFELSIDAYNKINTVFMPVPQAYTAYTPYLDKKNADFIEDNQRAPDYIFFSWPGYNGNIDNRFPLIDSPAAWLQIFNYYSIISTYENHILFRRKNIQINTQLKKIYSKTYQKSEWIQIPEYKSIVVMKANISYNIWGKIFKFFFQIPATYIEAVYNNDTVKIKRIIPEVLLNPTIISNLPTNLNSVKLLFDKNKEIERVKKFRLLKDRISWFLYKKDIEISFYTINQKNN